MSDFRLKDICLSSRLTSLQRYIAAEYEQETRTQFPGPGPTLQGLVTWSR
jgi:hypothetical protein